ncbi:IclR family transcriptional regulator [Halalkalicoccus sp. GCM10025322]|uniref:IclR family transcriptional regulator n=2 Tax=Halococcaceae TaxID=1963270 RepID=UPI00360A6123
MTSNKKQSRIKSVNMALNIIQYLHENPSSTLRRIADSLNTSTSTAHRHLNTLHEQGYVVMENNTYRLSLKFLTYGGKVREELSAHEMIERKVYQLGNKTAERTQFLVEEHGERVYAYTYAGQDAVKTDAAIGKRGPLHVSAAGKAILAELPSQRIDEILSESLSVRKKEDLLDELRTIRERGYAFNDEESIPGLRAVGVPVMRPDKSVLGAISVSGPAERLRGEYFREELPSLLLGTVNEIELNLKYS